MSDTNAHPTLRYEGWTLPMWEEFEERVAIIMADGVSEEMAKTQAHALILKNHSCKSGRGPNP
jgi:hypothetical protein